MNESNQIKSIRDILSMQELCCQLAEEASELSQAALKFRRALTKENYTPVSIDTALDSLKKRMCRCDCCNECIGLYQC